MSIEYVNVEEAIARGGLRMVVVGDIPSPWSEAAKGIFHIKKIPWTAVRLAYDSKPLKEWAGQRSAPVVVHENEPPRSGWEEILLLAERLAPEPSLLPRDAADRALVFGLSHELCGEQGLGWARRLQLIEAGLKGRGGFTPQVAAYLGKKYGYTPEGGARAADRVAELLEMFASRLKKQRAAGSDYLVGTGVTASDIHCAAFMAMFRPLPQSVCAMNAETRAAFESRDARTDEALDEALLEHRELMYRRHLVLPLSL